MQDLNISNKFTKEHIELTNITSPLSLPVAYVCFFGWLVP